MLWPCQGVMNWVNLGSRLKVLNIFFMMKGSLSPPPPPSLPLLPSTYNDVLNQDTSRLITTNTQFTDILAILTTTVTILSHVHTYIGWIVIIVRL